MDKASRRVKELIRCIRRGEKPDVSYKIDLSKTYSLTARSEPPHPKLGKIISSLWGRDSEKAFREEVKFSIGD